MWFKIYGWDIIWSCGIDRTILGSNPSSSKIFNACNQIESNECL